METMVAIALFSVILLAISALAATSLHTSRRGEQRLRAETLAQSLLEEKRRLPFDRLNEGEGDPVAISQDDTGLPGAIYRVGIDDLDEYGGRLKEIDVQVSWRSRGQTLTVSRALRVAKIPK
jgi:type II secretory pathway component PulJ